MNKIQKYFYDQFKILINDKINNLGTNLDGSTENQIIFYRLHDSGEEAFEKRLCNSNPGLIILNRKPRKNLDNLHLIIDEPEFEKIQIYVLNLLYPLKVKSKIVGITGTNGKTSVCYFGMQIANQIGLKSISVGTIGVYGKSGRLNSEHRTTTPSFIEFHKILYEYKPEVVFVELSSHALDQKRLGDLYLDAAGFTNFTQDHLDYHQDMESYFLSKIKIINLLKDKNYFFVNDSERSLIDSLLDLKINLNKVSNLNLNSKNIVFNLDFNLKNLSLAFEILRSIQPSLNLSDLNLNIIKAPPGRFDVVEYLNNSYGVVDYAHTPDAVAKIINGVKKSFREHQIITVIGCGGNRDKTKRPIMGQVACEKSDVVIFTSDNPRFENPDEIITDMTKNLIDSNFIIEPNRESAIKKGVELISKKSILLILGKGHEDYQEINGVKHPFDDKQVLKRFIEEFSGFNN